MPSKGFTRVKPDVKYTYHSPVHITKMKEINRASIRKLYTFTLTFLLATIGLQGKQAKWMDLFNGKNLDNWHNPYPHGTAKVKEGIIELVANKKFFFAYNKKFSNFIMVAEIKLPEGKANSGILFRSQKKDNGSMFGYQAEVDGSDRRWSGGLYDEGRRGWIHPKKPVQNAYNEKNWKDERKNALRRSDWNKYKIKCEGDHLQIWVNGIQTTNLKDNTDSNGYIAIQHHGEKGQVYRFRNLRLLEL